VYVCRDKQGLSCSTLCDIYMNARVCVCVCVRVCVCFVLVSLWGNNSDGDSDTLTEKLTSNNYFSRNPTVCILKYMSKATGNSLGVLSTVFVHRCLPRVHRKLMSRYYTNTLCLAFTLVVRWWRAPKNECPCVRSTNIR
jgi:hypothetical protein